jgi:hypothetical protein
MHYNHINCIYPRHYLAYFYVNVINFLAQKITFYIILKLILKVIDLFSNCAPKTIKIYLIIVLKIDIFLLSILTILSNEFNTLKFLTKH